MHEHRTRNVARATRMHAPKRGTRDRATVIVARQTRIVGRGALMHVPFSGIDARGALTQDPAVPNRARPARKPPCRHPNLKRA